MIKGVIHWTDTHIGAAHQLLDDTARIEEDFKDYKHNSSVLVIATGDIIDVKNAPKKEIKHYIAMRDNLKKTMKDFYLLGNHECKKDIYYCKTEGIMWMHFHVKSLCDSFTESCSAVIKYEKMKPGKGKIYSFFYKLRHMIYKTSKNWKPSKKLIADIVDFAKANDCHAVFLGHTHKSYDKVHDGIRIINSGRGRKEYKLS